MQQMRLRRQAYEEIKSLHEKGFCLVDCMEKSAAFQSLSTEEGDLVIEVLIKERGWNTPEEIFDQLYGAQSL